MKFCTLTSTMSKVLICLGLIIVLPLGQVLAEEKFDKLNSYVNSLVSRVDSIVHDTTLSEEAKIAKCKTLLSSNLDLVWMAKYTLGRYKKTITEAEINNFIQVYSRYVTKTYSDLVRNYKGEKAIVKNVRRLDDDEYMVKTEVVRTNGQPSIKADYLVREYKGAESQEFKVADVITEGISMITSQQSEFGSIISSGGFDALVRELEKKIN